MRLARRPERISGITLGPALELPACPICTVVADALDWDLWYLLRQGIADPPTRARVRDAFGFCHVHFWAVLQEEYRDLGSRLETALLCDMALSALRRHLEATQLLPLGNSLLRPSADCLLCHATRDVERSACRALVWALGEEGMRRFYPGTHGLCSHHLPIALERADAASTRLLLLAARETLLAAQLAPAAICGALHGRDPAQPPERARRRTRLALPLLPGRRCPSCERRSEAERREAQRLLAQGRGGPSDTWLCKRHAWELLSIDPEATTELFALETRAVLGEMGALLARPSDDWPRPRGSADAVLDWLVGGRTTGRPLLRVRSCSICLAGQQAGRHGPADAWRQCLPHLRQAWPGFERAQQEQERERLLSRAITLSGGIEAYLQGQIWSVRAQALAEERYAASQAVAFLAGEPPRPLMTEPPG